MARDRRRYLSWDDLIEAERGFFRGNALLRGLKPERWGIPTLKVRGVGRLGGLCGVVWCWC